MSTPPYLDLPPGARALRLDTARGQLAAVDVPPSGDRRGTALLVPGFTGSKEDFVAVLRPLSTRGWRVVAVDQRGQHQSPWARQPQGYDVESLADDVLAVIAALDDGPVHLLGHSFGGLVTRRAVLRADAPRAAVASLTLLCSGPAAIPEPRADRLRRLIAAVDALDLATIWAVIRQLDAENGVPVPAEHVARFLEHRFIANDPVSLRRFAEQLLVEPDRVEELAALAAAEDIPLLVAHGAADDAWPLESQKEMAARLGAGYEVIAGGAHSPAAEVPGATAAMLDAFWTASTRGVR